ncbi:MAG: sugar phosphate isomerase/epimerase family protein [Bryobacteraceae bacterium]
MNRRTFLASATAAAAPAAAPARFRKGICEGIFPAGMPIEERFRRTRDAGFEGIELRSGNDIKLSTPPDEVKRIADQARRAGVEIVSLWSSEPLGEGPLNSPDPEKRARGVAGVRKIIEYARYLNCGASLLVPGRLGSGPRFEIGYQDSWDRITAEMRKLLPDAAKYKVCLTPENVWSKFLVSPRDARDFVDQFKSPWVGFHFDVGNVMQFGYPEDWILTLGQRIKAIHVKDYKLSSRAEQGRFVDLMEGDVNWKGVMAALVKTGYRGFLSPEIGRNDDPDQLKKLSATLDRILALA